MKNYRKEYFSRLFIIGSTFLTVFALLIMFYALYYLVFYSINNKMDLIVFIEYVSLATGSFVLSRVFLLLSRK